MLNHFIRKELICQALSQLIFGMVGALLVLTLTHHIAPTIATVNITGLEDSFIRATSRQPLTEAEKKQRVMLFAKVLNQTVMKIAKDKHLILLPSQAVISDALDVTQEVADQIKKGLAT
jgi:type-F conjugative transfer system protein TrbI